MNKDQLEWTIRQLEIYQAENKAHVDFLESLLAMPFWKRFFLRRKVQKHISKVLDMQTKFYEQKLGSDE